MFDKAGSTGALLPAGPQRSPQCVAVSDVAEASFPQEPASAPAARRFLRGFLAEHGRDDLRDAAELALSEIVTNAVLHAHSAFDVAVALEPDGALRVGVTDGNAQLPWQRQHGEQATTGRGLDLVAALTAECGIQSHAQAGKTVWFVVRQTSDEVDADTLLATWDVEDDADPLSEPPATAAITFVGLPVVLWLAARDHHEAVIRELALHAARHPADAPTPERLALADLARGYISARVAQEVASAGRPQPARPSTAGTQSPATLDLVVTMSASAAESFGALQDVLDSGERLAAAGLLLAHAGLPEVVAVRDWACEQVIAQLAGVAPSPWPGTGQERFVSEVPNTLPAGVPDWDSRLVTEATTGAVAADDANRIIAISRPLADRLGWAVDDLIGRRVVALVPPELREAHVAGWTRYLATGEAHVLGVPLRLPVVCADGSRLECDLLIEQMPTRSTRTVYVAWMDPTASA